MIVIAVVVVWTIRERFFQPELLTIQEAAQKAETLYAGSIESFEQVGETYEMTLERDNKIYKLVIDAKTGEISILNAVSITESAGIYKSEKQIRAIVAEQNKGDVQTITTQKTNNTLQYVVDVVQGDNSKTLLFDAKSGKIMSEKLKSSTIATSKEPNTTADTKKTNHTESTTKQNVNSSSGNNANSNTNIKDSTANQTKDTNSSNNSGKKNEQSNTNQSTANSNTIISQSRAIQIARAQLKGEVDDVKYEKTADGGYYLIEIEGKDNEAVFQINAVSGKIMSITQDDDKDKSDDKDND